MSPLALDPYLTIVEISCYHFDSDKTISLSLTIKFVSNSFLNVGFSLQCHLRAFAWIGNQETRLNFRIRWWHFRQTVSLSKRFYLSLNSCKWCAIEAIIDYRHMEVLMMPGKKRIHFLMLTSTDRGKVQQFVVAFSCMQRLLERERSEILVSVLFIYNVI